MDEDREPNRLFDSAYYRSKAGLPLSRPAFAHYLRDGWRAGLDPGPNFCVNDYLAECPDVRESGVEPLGHYISAGYLEGRRPFAGYSLPEPLDGSPQFGRPDEAPRFSVLLPCFNHGRFLSQALDSLLAQHHQYWEAIVVDDGSTDETPQICVDYSGRDNRIRFVRQPNGGIAAALNAGLREARYDWLMWLSADDLMRPDRMTVAANWIHKYPNIGLFHSDYGLLHEATNRIRACAHDAPDWLPTLPHWQSLAMLHSNLISGITAVFHRRLATALGGFDETLRYAQDYQFWLKASRRVPIAFIPQELALSRTYARQTTLTHHKDLELETIQVCNRFLDTYPLHRVVGGCDAANPDQLFAANRWAIELATSRGGILGRNGRGELLFDWIARSIDVNIREAFKMRLDLQLTLQRRRIDRYGQEFERLAARLAI
jgi:Glycosyl transferase family 2